MDVATVGCLFILASLLNPICGQCNDNGYIGNSVDTADNGDNLGKYTLLHRRKISCCGYIDRWELRSTPGMTPVSIVTAQVWHKGSPWTLLGKNILPVNLTDDVNGFDIPADERIFVKPDSYIGYYDPTGNAVGGKGGKYKSVDYMNGTTFNWTEVPEINSEPKIRARIQTTGNPSFVNLDGLVMFYSDAVTGGEVLYSIVTATSDGVITDQLQVTYSNTGTASTMFQFDSFSRNVTVTYGAIMVPGDHDMDYTVSDGCNTATGTLTLRVLNVPPVLTSLATDNETSIPEALSTKTLLHELIVTDSQPVSCSILTTGVPFVMEAVPGNLNNGIYLIAGANMDYYSKNTYVLEISCSDGYDDTTGYYTVNLILDVAPTIIGLPLGIDATEQSTIERTVYNFSVFDPENVSVKCNYTITPSTAVIFLKPSTTTFNGYDIILQSNAGLNYDVVRSYQVDIECSDGRRSDTSVFFLNVIRNQPPVFVNLPSTATISSLTSRISQLVYNANATDPEEDQLKYSISCSVGTSCPFQIFSSGEIVLTRSVKGEKVPAYDIFVYVTDDRTTVGPRSLTVYIKDINYAPLITNLPLPSPLVIAENSALNKSVFQVSIQDYDKTDVHKYSMTSIPSDGMLFFQINSTTGLVSTSSSTMINYESGYPTSYTLSITVSDTKDSVTKNLSLTISDVKEAVRFTKKTYAIGLTEGPGGTVLTDPGYLYTDQDTGDTHTYGIDCGTGVGYFSINSTNGKISLIADIDVDATGSMTTYACTVTISDGTFKDTAAITFTVSNINDNTPVFSSNLYTFYLDIETSVNSVFGSAVATDGDTGTFGTFTYSVNQSHLGTETFGINSDGGLYLKNPLTSFGYGRSLKFQLHATDSGGLQGFATVYILIPQLSVVEPTDSDRYVTFWEYPANAAWMVVASFLGLVCFTLPCYMINKYGGSISCKGRVGEDPTEPKVPRTSTPETLLSASSTGRYELDWKPWRWFEMRHT